MSSSAKQDSTPLPIDGGVTPMSCDDTNQSVVIATKAIRNVQTQHGDYRSVDEENIVLIAKLVFDEPPREGADSSLVDVNSRIEQPGSSDGPPTGTDQVVWIEPFKEDGTEVKY